MHKIGLDKISLSKICIKKIDNVKALESKVPVQLDYDLSSDLFGIKFLKIKDNNKFGTLAAGMKKDKVGCKHYFCRLDFSPSNIYGNNLNNMNINECRNALSEIQVYLINEYGIYIDYRDAVFTKMEVNCNIVTDYEYKEYAKLLELICYSISDRSLNPYMMEVKKINKEQRRFELETIMRRNKSMELIVYNKLEQLRKKKIEVEGNPVGIMRVEIKLLNGRRIQEAFKTNSLNKLTDKQIEDFYRKQINKYLIVDYERWKQGNKQFMRKIIKEKAKERGWITELLLYCNTMSVSNNIIPVIADINDYIDIVNEFEGNGHEFRNRKRIIDYNRKYIHIPDNINRNYNELITKLIS